MSDIKIDKLIRSRRKSIGLQITRDASLIVRAPYHVSEDFIYQLVCRKASWIKTKQEYFKSRQEKTIQRHFVNGEQFLFLGQWYPLTVVDHLPKAIIFDNSSLMISSMVLKNTKEHLELWYKKEALAYFTQRVDYYTRIHHLQYHSIKISSATSRWGSCGYNDALNFSWRLIMAPLSVIDYVVIHELMHLKQKNHSRSFWQEVSQAMPDYKKEEQWLKHNSHLLAWD